MNYLLTQDQRDFQTLLERFLKSKVDSLFLHRLADQTDGWQHSLFELWREFSALGFAGLLVPTDYQGMGCSLSDAAILAETLGAYLTPLPFIEHQLCCLAITLAGSPEQKQMWLPKLASGECVGTVAFHSGDGGFHPTSWTLCKDDSGETQLKFCPSLGISDVPHLVVTGMHNGELALIAPDDLQLTPQVPSTMDLTRYLAAVRFAKPQIQSLPNGRNHSNSLFNAGLALLAADAIGGIIACVDRCAEYANVREQFGVRIGQFQAVKHQIAEMALLGEPNRPLCRYAAHAVEINTADAARVALLTKSHVCDAYLTAARQTVELHGGFGYTWEADMHLHLKRAMFNSAYFENARQLRSRLKPHAH